MRLSRNSWALAMMFASASAVGGSRVGGGTLSSDTDLYTMNLPPLFNGGWDRVTNNWIRLKGPTSLVGARFERNVIEIPSLRERYPAEVLSLDRKSFIAYFKARGFLETKASDACVALMKLVKSSGIFVIGTWGSGRGVIVTGPRSESVMKGIDELTGSLKLLPGGCGWN